MPSELLPSAVLGDIVHQSTDKAVINKRADWPYVGLEHLETGSPYLAGCGHSSASKSTNNVFREGDVLFGKLRPYLRKSIGAPFAGYCSTDILVLRPNNDVAPSFAAKVFQSEPVFAEAVATSIGTKMPRTSWGSLRRLQVFCPSFPEQRRIAEILDALDEAIRKTEQVIAKLQQMKQGLLHDLLTRGIDNNGELRDPERHPEQFKDSPLGRIPRGWEVVPLGAGLISDIYRYPTFYGIRWTATGVGVLKVGNLSADGYISRRLDEIPHISLDTNRRFPRTVLSTHDLIMAVRGATIGRIALVGERFSGFNINPNLIKVSPTPSRLDARYLWSFMNAQAGKIQFDRVVSSTAKETITVPQFMSIQIPLPPTGEQGRINSILNAHGLKTDLEQSNATKLRTLKHGLMDDILTGQVRVSVTEEVAA